jgi:fructokinase
MSGEPKRPVVVGLGEVLWDLLPEGRQLGGAPANLAYHARALGADAAIVSGVGDDPPGREILDRLRALGFDLRTVAVVPKRPTGTVSVELGPKGIPTFTIHENVAWDFIPWSHALAGLAVRCDAVCFGSLCQRSPVSRQTVRTFVQSVRPEALRVFDINLRQGGYDREAVHALLLESDVFKVSDNELPVVAKLIELPGGEGAWVHALLDRYPLRCVALTRGSKGSLLESREGRSIHPGIPAVNIVDTVGAGDAFTASLVLGLLRKKPLDAINEAANRLAAYVCTQHGAMPEVPEALRNLL